MKKIALAFLFLAGFSIIAINSQPLTNERPSVALVLGGGAARGFAHIAVLEVIEELGIPVDMVAGVSSGAIVGGLYAAGYSPSMIMEVMNDRDWGSFFQDRPASPFWTADSDLPLAIHFGGSSGLISPTWGLGYSNGQKVYELFKALTAKIPSYINFNDLPIPFRAGAAEIPSGKFQLLGEGDLAEAIRASMSIQGVFDPLTIDGHSYVDGGFLNNLPVREIREMGYEIIIAVDLFRTPDDYSIALLDLPELMVDLYSGRMSVDQRELADVVLFPLPGKVPSADFDKGKEIYSLARANREELITFLLPLREKITMDRTAGNKGNAYDSITPLIPQRMIINGALSRDRSYIEKKFIRHLKGKVLDEGNITDFLEIIYETGNYSLVQIRTDLRSGEACLELVLKPMEENKVFIRAGLDFEGTFSSRSSNRTAVKSGVEFQGKEGLSILMKFSAIDELSVSLSMLWPLGPHFFLSASAFLVRDQVRYVNGLLDITGIEPDRLLYFMGNLKGGIRFNSHNSFTLWPEYYWFKDAISSYSMAGAGAAYTFSNINHFLFPSRGFRMELSSIFRFAPETNDLFDICGLDLSAHIPLGDKFSLGSSIYGHSLFGETSLPAKISTFTPGNTNRVYFPHITGADYGENKAAVSVYLQFEPLENLSLLGGRMLFLLSFSSGGFIEWKEWDDFWNNRIVWNASLGSALLPTKGFGILVRGGVGGAAGLKPLPFVSLDIGLFRFQHSLF